jgi:type I restriction enzyme M protein
MNMVMNNDGSGGLFQGNSLEAPVQWDLELRKCKLLDNVDLLFTNPPFGSKIPVTDHSILEQYDLGHTWNYDKSSDQWSRGDQLQKSQPPEILFIERCVRFLKPGTGRMAIVLPDGILGSPGLGYVRQWIMRNARVLASIDMHTDTFQPFVSIQTSILVLERKPEDLIAVEDAAGRMNDYSVFMAVANHVGHDKRGTDTFVRDKKGNEVIEEIEEQIKDWQDGTPVYRKQVSRRKVRDDNTLQIAQEFRRWLSTQD